MADLMASGMPDGSRIVDRGLTTFLLESQRGRWQIVRALHGYERDYLSAITTWPAVKRGAV